MGVRFNAGTDELRRTANLPADDTAFTMAAWFKISVDTADFASLLGLEDTVAPAKYDLVYLNNDSLITLQMDSSAAGSGAIKVLSVGSWYYIAMIGGASVITCYVRGESETSWTTGTATRGNLVPNRMDVGNNQFAQAFNGVAAAIKCWDANLTQAELEAEMRVTLPRRYTNLNIWSPAHGADYDVDFSGNARTWTKLGSTTFEQGPPLGWGAPAKRRWYSLAAAPGGLSIPVAMHSYRQRRVMV